MALQHFTKENFESLVLNSDKPVLVDFWATWCGPCKMIAPIVEQIAAERSDIAVGKINVDEEGELAIRYGVSSIPTLMLFVDGKVARTTVGYQPKEQLLSFLG